MATSLESTGASPTITTLTRERPAALQKAIGTEQRAHRRYPIQLDAEFDLLNKRKVKVLGYGKTLNISSGGVLFMTDDFMPDCGLIKLAMNWPFLLEGAYPLRLVVHGCIVRNNGRLVAIQTTRHEFRTAGVYRSTGGLAAINRRGAAAAGAVQS